MKALPAHYTGKTKTIYTFIIACGFWLMAASAVGQSITVINPTSGELYGPGTDMNISWTHDLSGSAHFGIDLLDTSGNVVQNIVAHTSNSMGYTWSIPSGINLDDYKIEVYDMYELCMGGNPGCGYWFRGSYEDQSGVFTIEVPELDFEPGYDWSEVVAGEDFYFEWDHNFTNGQLELHHGAPLSGWTLITTLPTSATSYTWTTPSGDFPSFTNIRVRSTAHSGLEDEINISLLNDIEVTAPGSSVSKLGGETLNVTWNANYNGGNVSIKLYKGGSLDQTLTSSTSNDGAYNWNIPGNITSDSNYQIRIEDAGNSSVNDMSPNLTLTSRNITVTSPTSSTDLIGGNTLNINWNSNFSNNVRIDLYKNGSLNQTINSSTSNDGAYNWTVPDGIIQGSDYQIRVKDKNSSVKDFSPNFNLVPREITITSPTSSTDLVGGNALNISWSTNYSGGDVRIELRKDLSVYQTLTTSTANDGSYNWSVPTDIPSDGYYWIRIEEVGNSTTGSSSQFTMNPRTLTVSSPISSTDQIGGTTLNIAWSSNFSDNVRIELYRFGVLDQTLASSTSNDGSYNWTIPDEIPSGSNYQVRIEDTSTSIEDYTSSFTMNSQSITVTNPTSSTDLIGNSTLNINWNTNYTGGNVRIELHKGGSLDQTLTTSTANDGSYNWTVPIGISQGSDYQVLVKRTDNAVDDFTSYFDLTPREITVTSPTSSTDLVGGNNLNIAWTSSFTENVRIELHKNGSLDQTLTSSTANDGSYTWTLPDQIAAGSNYQMRVKDTGTSVDDHSANFTMDPKNITVTSPTASTNHAGGNTLNITWDENYGNASVQVDLYKGGSLEQTLDASVVLNDQSYSWEVPATITSGSDYQIRITDNNNGSINDYSPNFTLTKASFTVTNPTGSTQLLDGDNITITWDDNFSPDTVGIDLLNGDGTVNQTIASPIGNSQSYAYASASPTPDTTEFRIEVYNMTALYGLGDCDPCYVKGSISDQSSLFSLWPHKVAITQPLATSGGQAYDENLSIQWSTTVSPVTIELVGNDQTWMISSSEPSTTSYPSNPVSNTLNWTMPAEASPGSYYIRITSSEAADSSGVFEYDPFLVQAQQVASYDNYDQYGNLLAATDANGATRRFYYGSDTQPFTQDGQGTTNGEFLTGMTKVFAGGTDSLTTSGSYNGLGWLTGMTAENGVQSSFSYDNLGRLKQVKNDAGQVVSTIDYKLEGARFSASKPNWVKTNIFRTDSDTSTAKEYIDGLGRTVQSQQEADSGKVVAVTEYDGQGRAFRRWKPYIESGGSVAYKGSAPSAAGSYYDTIYGSNSIPYQEQHFEENPLGRPTEMIPEGGEAESGKDSTAYRIDNWDGGTYEVTTRIDAEGNSTETWSDGWGRTIKTVAAPNSADSAVTVFEYDMRGNLTKVKSPNYYDPPAGSDSTDWMTTYQYDVRGQLTQKTSPDAGTVKYTYDNAGNLRFSQDANRAAAGEVAFTSYDELGRPTAEGVASASFGSLDGDTDYPFETANANLHGVYGYDSKPGTSNNYPFDQFVTELGSVSLSNTQGQMTARAWRVDDGSSSVMGANPWQLEVLSYDSEGLLADKWVWTGDNPDWAYYLQYSYNRAGELIRQKLTVGSETLYHHYTYNKRGLLAAVYLSDNGNYDPQTDDAEITYSYSATGAVEQVDYRGGTTITNGYDIRERLTDINNINSTSGSPFAAKYTYLKNGNVDQAEFWNPNITTTQNLSSAHRKYSYAYGYDGLNRLTSADYKLDGSNPNAFDVPTIDYDGAGNIDALRRRDQAGVLVDDLDYKYENGNNQLSGLTENASSPHSWDPKGGSFTYDANGNLATMTGNTTLSGVTYDHRNLPTQFDLSASTQQVNGYSIEGQRVLKEVQTSGGTTWSFYIMDGLTTLGLIQDSTLQYLNVLGNDVSGRVLASSGAIDADNAKRYYIKDLIGSTRAVVDENGATTENRDYYPYGLLMDERQYVQGVETTEKFSGKERDDQTGFDYFGARFYVSGIGRWLSVDPLASQRPGLTPYNYVQNNPVIRVDPTGLLDDYAYNRRTGELTLVRRTDDEEDRIVKVDKDGEIKTKGGILFGLGKIFMSESKAKEARVEIDNIEKGILKDGMNLKYDDNVIDLGEGEDQASLKGVEEFLVKFSNFIGKEMSGAYLSPQSGSNAAISKVYIDEYGGKNPNTVDRAFTSLSPLYGNPALSSLNTVTHFHTHVASEYGDGDLWGGLYRDNKFKSENQRYFNRFVILARTGKKPFSYKKKTY